MKRVQVLNLLWIDKSLYFVLEDDWQGHGIEVKADLLGQYKLRCERVYYFAFLMEKRFTFKYVESGPRYGYSIESIYPMYAL